ncbi:MAG: hypothetical protein JWR54_3422 [Mucilaginibacter sp.]|nr:hypothetical protein [Mucilaginibacter sp.]
MKVVHVKSEAVQEPPKNVPVKKIKRVPLYKNDAAIDEMVKQITRENNEKVLKARSKK